MKNEKFVAFIEKPLIKPVVFILLKMYAICGMGWSLTPFVILSFSKWWPIYSTLNYYGLLLYVPWPFVYKPLLKQFLKVFFPIERKPTDAGATTAGNGEQKLKEN